MLSKAKRSHPLLLRQPAPDHPCGTSPDGTVQPLPQPLPSRAASHQHFGADKVREGEKQKVLCSPWGDLDASSRPQNSSASRSVVAGFAPLMLQRFPGCGPPLQDSSRDLASPALSGHTGGGRLHNSFPVSRARQGLSEAPAAKCNVSPLTPTPAAQPAVARPASGCALRLQPGPFPPRCGVGLPSPCPEKGPRAESRGRPCSPMPAGTCLLLGGSQHEFPCAENKL